MTATRALVLGGGGVAGIAWETGIVAGMAEAGLDPLEAEFIVGTSAGATVAAQITSGRTPDHWFQRQIDPALQNAEIQPTGMSVEELWETMVAMAEETTDPLELRRQVGALALAADTVPEPVRRAVVAGRLDGATWPERQLATVAVDAFSGKRFVFDASSGVDLVDAVAASSAVPGVWPPVTIGSTRYIDGGVTSLTNADLVVGFDRVLVLAPMTDPDLEAYVSEAEGVRILVVSPDEASMVAFGTDPLSPAVMAPCALAGLAQAREAAAALTGFWGS
jgi:NTE family protein